MSKDFFKTTSKNVSSLNKTERQLYEYTLKNMDKVKDMSIQKLAAEQFLSTTTIFRFTQKLGFSGYSDFIGSLLFTSYQKYHMDVPDVMREKIYREEYIKNILEAVRVMPKEKIKQVHQVLDKKPQVYIITDEEAHDIGRYCEKLFIGIGLYTYFPEAGYQTQVMLERIKDDDLLIVLSYSSTELALLETIKRILVDKKPFLLSFTRADNNIVQNLSDVNFFIFVDEIILNNINLTTHVPIMMLVELIIYEYIGKT
jgi:RpiR family glv operon transcriptional regulator